MFALMKNREIYRHYLQQLQKIYSANEAAVITDWVFERVAGLQRGDIIRSPDQTVVPEKLNQLNDCLTSLLEHKPVQHVLGEAWFYKMKLKVNEEVLIPRPETEELVQLVVDNLQRGGSGEQTAISNQRSAQSMRSTNAIQRISMLDIGTGSGCIAIAVKKNIPGVSMTAIDVSEGALIVAKENAATQQTAITFLQVNFLDKNTWKDLAVYDVIISNPPYIPINEKDKLDKNVTAFEPHTALFVPDNEPLLFYKKIAAFGLLHLTGSGKIYVEMHEDFAEDTAEVFKKQYRVEIRKDIFGKERMLVATMEPS